MQACRFLLQLSGRRLFGDDQPHQAVQRVPGAVREEPLPVPPLWSGGAATGIRQVFKRMKLLSRAALQMPRSHFSVFQVECHLRRHLHAEQACG